MTNLFGIQINAESRAPYYGTPASQSRDKSIILSETPISTSTAPPKVSAIDAYNPNDTAAAYKQAVKDPFFLTGPSPTFKFNVLDVGGDWRSIIASNQSQRSFETNTFISSSNTNQSNAIISADLSTPTERYDSQIHYPPATLSDPDTLPVPTQQTLAIVPAQIQDPQAAYAGLAAIQVTPYSSILDINV